MCHFWIIDTFFSFMLVQCISKWTCFFLKFTQKSLHVPKFNVLLFVWTLILPFLVIIAVDNAASCPFVKRHFLICHAGVLQDVRHNGADGISDGHRGGATAAWLRRSCRTILQSGSANYSVTGSSRNVNIIKSVHSTLLCDPFLADYFENVHLETPSQNRNSP